MNIKDNNSYTDHRGTIQMILENCNVGSISRIDTLTDNERASHWHKNDGHWILITQGKVIIYERPLGSEEKPTRIALNVNDLHFTGPLVEHTMFMPEDTIFYCFSTLKRDSENYENETVRLPYSLYDLYNEWEDGRFERGTQ